MVVDRINNWFHRQKQFFFTYSNGFFNLSYLANSPEVMLKSLSKMPFMRYDHKRQAIFSDNSFNKGELFYAELEKGLWIFNSNMKYKNNVSFTPIHDKLLPSDYFFIALNNVENEPQIGGLKLLNNFKIANRAICFSRPATNFIANHFKGSKEKIFILYFSEEWVVKNIENSVTVPKTVKNLLNNPEINFLTYSIKEEDFSPIYNSLRKGFHELDTPNIFELKKSAYEFLSLFFNSLEEKENLNSNELSHRDRIKIQKIEHFLSNRLYQKFPGIDFLADKYKISATKLKQNFKILYGKTIYSYFQHNKMQVALEYVLNSDLKIKDISLKFEYENVSKFSKAFQKCHNKLPSELRK